METSQTFTEFVPANQEFIRPKFVTVQDRKATEILTSRDNIVNLER